MSVEPQDVGRLAETLAELRASMLRLERSSRVQPAALTKQQAADRLGVSIRWFDQNVSHDLPRLRSGRLVRYPTAAVDQWLRDHLEDSPASQLAA